MCIHCNKHASLSPQPDSLPPQRPEPPAVDNSHELHHQQKRRKLVYPPPVAYQLRVPTSFDDSRKSPETILGKEHYEDIRDHYALGKELGRGRFGITYLCIENSTGKAYACKSILKKRLSNRRDRDDVRREIAIMEHLKGQPNVVQFKGAYEDKDSVHLVMELCAGGELFDRLTVKGQYSEKAAAAIIRSILNAVHFCHFKGVMHRDLKPENFLLSTNGEGAILKATDFGLSVFIEEGKVYRDVVGSAYYIAPEVLQRNYGKEIDIWSAGVILYILLSGIPPFYAEDDKGIFDAIVKGEVNFDRKPWASISESAKDLIRKMLTMDPKKRITSSEALEHQWLRETGEDRPIDGSVIARMNCFVIFTKLRKLGSKIKMKLRCYKPPAKEKLP